MTLQPAERTIYRGVLLSHIPNIHKNPHMTFHQSPKQESFDDALK